MDYEKAYTNAVSRAKQAIKECGDNKGRISMIESIFPELKVSEDERIRKGGLKHGKDEQEIEFLRSLMFQASTQQALNTIIDNRIKLLKGE